MMQRADNGGMTDFKLHLNGSSPETVEECHRLIEALWQVLGEFQKLKARVGELEEQLGNRSRG